MLKLPSLTVGLLTSICDYEQNYEKVYDWRTDFATPSSVLFHDPPPANHFITTIKHGCLSGRDGSLRLIKSDAHSVI